MNLDQKKFTRFSFAYLQTWVIWQFPRPLADGLLCGAIRSTAAGSLWWPACIDSDEQVVYLCTASDQLFATPEAAVAFLETAVLE